MNLGDIYIKTFLAISALGICAAVFAALLICRLRKRRVGPVVGLALLASVFIVPLLNVAFHRSLFVKWHQSQNLMVPSTGCRSYDPDFMTLQASYSMSKSDFVSWAESHPGNMRLYSFRDEKGNLELIDEKRLGFVDAELIYATEMAPNGRQLRAYFRDGIMYLSYNVM
ncbi:hypothetical protein [Rhodopirellula bahusiensis]